MPSGTIAPPIKHQFFDDNGDPLSNGQLWCYQAGTTTHEPIYQDWALTTAHPQPAELDASGRITIFLSATSYRFILKDSAGVAVTNADVDNITALAGVGGSTGIDVAGVAGEAIAINDACFLSDGSGGLNPGRWYRTDADDVNKSTLPKLVRFATAAIITGASGFFRLEGRLDGFVGLTPGAPYYVSGATGAITSVEPGNSRFVGQADSATTLIIISSTPITSDNGVCEGRLTLTTAVPVTTADVTAATTLYFTPYRGNRCAVYDGASWSIRTFAELSIAIPATTSQMYDVFIYNNAGALALELLAWTNDTTRATALVLQDGVYVKTGALTRRYLGSFRTTTIAGQTEDSLTKRLIWNYHNRVPRLLQVFDTTASWAYHLAVWRQMRATPANKVELIVGWAESPVDLMLKAAVGSDGGAAVGTIAAVAIGEDSITVPTAPSPMGAGNQVSNAAVYLPITTGLSKIPTVGYHYYAPLEIGSGAGGGVTNWFSGSTLTQSGLWGSYPG